MKGFNLPKVAFLLSCAVLAFLYGAAVGRYGIFPFSLIEWGQDAARSVVVQANVFLDRPVEFLMPARYEGSGVTRTTEGLSPGLTFLTGFFGEDNEARLIRSDGTIVNRWPLRVLEILPEAMHLEGGSPQSNWNAIVHGAQLLPDGSIIFNFTYVGAAKLDRCGSVAWRIPRPTHHAVSLAARGGFWIPSTRQIESGQLYPGLQVPYVEDTLLRVSSEGEILREISVLEILDKNNLIGVVQRVTGDLTHLNDVEELTGEMAEVFPQFAAGDLLLSLRFPSLVLVVDPATLGVKWYQSGPWRGQHDPDFVASGILRVFSNNEDGTAGGSVLGGSAVIDIDPLTREISYRYGGGRKPLMYTFDRGKQQTLDNENVLITEARSGRAFEVDPDGEIVWEYLNRYDDDNVAVLTEATRYPDEYFDVDDWTCP